MRNYFYLLLAFTLIPICSFAQIFGGQLKSAKAGTIGSINCSTATNNGTLTAGTTASNVSSTVPYTGGNGASYNGQTINSTGVTGLTAVLTAGSFANGSGTLTYAISGIPSTSGTASFALNIGGQICTLTRTVSTSSTGCGNQSTVTDIDGNVYPVVSIGSQCWMKENLKVTKFRNGNPISTNLNNTDWENTTSSAYAIYNNNAANNTNYGKVYNWFAVEDPRGLCPVGWHVPTDDAEWTTLENYLGGSSVAGGKLKSTSSLWSSPNTGATNESGFSGLPGGCRGYFGNYELIGNYGFWWTSTEFSPGSAWSRQLKSSNVSSTRYLHFKQTGCSVRCLRDASETGIINSLDCGTATNIGTPTPGIAAIGLSSSVPYKGGNGGTFTSQSISSIGVTGLTATLAAGNFANGNGSLNFSIIGTPASIGTASFVLNIGGQTCTLTREVVNSSTGCGNQSTVTDIDGNIYPVVIIGSQCWMKENLKVSKYGNGNPITTNLNSTDWQSTTSGAFAIYNDYSPNNTTYGKLYNWYAVADPRGLCPAGWHVPTDADWMALENYLGGVLVAGGKLKNTSPLWASPNPGTTDESGFSGLPGGCRNNAGFYQDVRTKGFWWSSTEYTSESSARYRSLIYGLNYTIRDGDKKQFGISVRCLKD